MKVWTKSISKRLFVHNCHTVRSPLHASRDRQQATVTGGSASSASVTAVNRSSLEEADDGARTRDLKLGKLALYQLSYVRVGAKATRRPDLSHWLGGAGDMGMPPARPEIGLPDDCDRRAV